jgi:Xaa-Pro aminopeptidase
MNNRVETIRTRLNEVSADAFICFSNPNYRYLSGFTGSLAILIISRENSIIISDFRYRTQIAEEVTNFDYVEMNGRIEETVVQQIAELKIKRLAFESAHLSYRQYAHLRSVDSLELVPTEEWVEDQRQIKDEVEIGLIEKAASVVDAVIESVIEDIEEGMTEWEVANRIYTMIRGFGGKKEAFDLIVASGPRSAMPHASPSDSYRIEAGRPIVIDIGAQFRGYHSDLTRTVWLDRIKEPQVLEMYDIVDKAQSAAIKAIRPGIPCIEIDAVARKLIAEAGYGDFFGHGLGHGVGLEVHESPTISRLGKGITKPGMVFTVEPGIYIPQIGGVRIEDMIVVTSSGCRRLTMSAHQPSIDI